ncbi:MAG: DNA-binding transcriptional regulator GbsR (MarR family) [Olleya marilimosa]|jgi:DNA-binding transcriptional regulator GbsR (MarR family)|uniref:HTH-type transcriptional regulator n=1 Tax=Olleya marilimosa TaxID=272164 RepID=A0ABR8LVX4_9FLAO|nr:MULTISPECIES: ArsR family transcriptional regulator [Olleya]MBD3864320.1 ArsR family transcriptional regulator [Olleya marilimosa]MBD3891777.1 ArsR family transcriptional regulator [Olleya marilimosa]PIB32568.1 transcriptional regulator [Gaetbulibacter sp. 5U11]TVZ47338.1 DNA-binding transcriptional regulator GbsR (MarR family) [Olleya sp. Hel_I_94]|tara:strand:+ start:115143 stop:115646 length:504 start_codon:yes stop_codon:yes gene_type:complete
MEYQEAKDKFISTWGSLGSLWGINKAMAQIQALLFISTKPLSMEEIMEDLKISRGNTSMNLRQLMDWGIVTKTLVAGERKEFFTTEKDVQELARIVAVERSRREIKPVVKVLDEVSSIKDDGTAKTKELIKQTKALHELTETMDVMINKLVNQKQNWITKSLLKLFK